MGGKLIAEYRDGTTYFRHDDHLGTARVLTMMNQAIHDSADFQPFGEQSSGDTGTTHKFTGKERDGETLLDDFGARYYSSTMGRFMTPDWAARPASVPYAVFGDPQSLNLYGYVRNDPVSMADADGHTWEQDLFGLGSPDEPKGGPPTCTSGRWSLSWQISASANFLGQELLGVADATITPVVNAVEHPVDTAGSIANAVEHPVDTAKNVVNGAVDTVKAAASGDPRAIGQVVATAATIAYTAENVKLRAYENTGGGGINLQNTPTTGSSIRFDVHPLEEGGPYRPHVDVTIKKPGVPSGEGSNLIKPIRHWPWE